MRAGWIVGMKQGSESSQGDSVARRGAVSSRAGRWASRALLGITLVVSTGLTLPVAHPEDAGISSVAMRGPGAQMRARVDRARSLAATAPSAEAVAAVDALLVDLRARLWDPAESLDVDTVLATVGELASLRTDLVLGELEPLNGSRRDFLRSVAAEATVGDWRYGVPASVTLAQAILESNWGRSAPGFNFFGLKGTGPAGSLTRRVVEYRHGRRHHVMASFRLYDDPAEAIRDHSELLGTSRHYGRARGAGEDRVAFAQGLQGVYATDPRYAGKLARLIDDQGLARFDVTVATPWR